MESLEREQQAEQYLSKIHDMKESFEAMVAAKRGHHLSGKPEFKKMYTRRQEEFFADLASLKRSKDPHRKLVAKIEELGQEWCKNAEPSFEFWQKRPKGDGLKDFFQEIFEKTNLERGVELIKLIRIEADSLKEMEIKELKENREEVLQKTRESTIAILVTVLVSIVLSIFVTQALTRSITYPLSQLNGAVASISEGRFETLIPHGPREVKELIRGFNLMGLALAERTALLEGSELRYRTVVGTTTHLLWTTTADGKNNDMTNWCALTGQQPEEIVGDGWLKAIHPDDRDRFVDHWEEVVSGKKYDENEFRIRGAKGDYRDFHCRSVPIFDSRGDVTEWVRICIDITERKQEEKLKREKETAESASRAKSEFLAKMSHELRTPLNAIIGMSKMLMTQRFGNLNEKQQDYLSDVIEAGEHLLTLINDILDLSKVEVGRLNLTSEPVHVGETVDQIISTLRTIALNKDIDIKSVVPNPKEIINTDLARFKQILYNLISNAIKFTPSGGNVSVRCHWVETPTREAPLASHQQADGLRIDVQDTGIGISKKDQEKLGTEFFQVASDPSKTTEGTGLGLALSRRLVEMMGGQFWFTSELGEGSTFSFAIPLELPDGSPESILSGAGEDEKKTGTQISRVEVEEGESSDKSQRPLALVIDDHRPTNKLLSDWLEEAGLQTASAFDGPGGLNEARDNNPQLILLDLRLPGVNGWEVLHQLKSQPETARIPVVVVSVLEGKDELKEWEIIDWFVKPLDKECLIERLRSALPELFLPGKSVLIVDNNNEQFRIFIRELLGQEGLTITEAYGGKQAFEQLENHIPDLILLELAMPQTNGFEVLHTIRDKPQWKEIPVIIVTDQEISSQDRQWLEENSQAIFRKDSVTREKFIDRLRNLL